MNLLQDLLEALKPSQYRQYVKGWNRSRYEEMFKKYSTDKKGYRIYIPFKGEPKKVDPDPDVEAAVKAAGYEIEDYITGIASRDSGKRKIKIGKLLKDPEVQKKFANDPKRASAKNVENFVVISRHPYDIAGMSTDRGWKSCMNLHDGVNKHYVPIDIKEGTLVAYFVKSDDKNINNPIARVLIKPFVNVDANAPQEHRIALGVEDRVYGTAMPGFRDTVLGWVSEVNREKQLDGIFEFHGNLYNDGGTKSFIGVGKTGEAYESVKADWKNIKNFSHPPLYLVKLALKLSTGRAIMSLQNPNLQAVHAAISYFHYNMSDDELIEVFKYLHEKGLLVPAIKAEILDHDVNNIIFFPDVTEEDLVNILVKQSYLYGRVPKSRKTESLNRTLIEKNPQIIGKIDGVGEKKDLQILAIEKAHEKDVAHSHDYHYNLHQVILEIGSAINGEKIDSEVIHRAVDLDHAVLEYFSKDQINDEAANKAFDKHPRHFAKIKNPTPDQIDRAIEHDPSFIRHVSKPTEEQILKAVKKDGSVLKYVNDEDQTEEIVDAAIDDDPTAIRYAVEELHSETRHHKFLDHHANNSRTNMGSSYLKNASPAIQLRAIKQHPDWIKTIKNPTAEAQMEAVKSDPLLITYVADPDEEALLTASKKVTKQDQFRKFVEAVIEGYNRNTSGYFIPSKTVLRYFFERDGAVIRELPTDYDENDDPVKRGIDDELARVAMKTYPQAIRWINEPTAEDVEFALKKDHNVFTKLKKDHHSLVPEKLKLHVLKKNGEIFEFFSSEDRSNVKYQLAAIKTWPHAVLYVPDRHVTEKVWLAALTSPAIGSAERILDEIIRNQALTVSLAKAAVEKDHEMFSIVKKAWSRAWAKKIFTPEVKDELTAIAKGKKEESRQRTLKIKKAISMLKEIKTVKSSSTLGQKVIKFKNDNRANFNDEPWWSANSYLRQVNDELIQMNVFITKVVRVIVEVEHQHRIDYIYAMLVDDEPVAWINDTDDEIGAFVKGLPKDKVKRPKKLKEHLCTFKDMLYYSRIYETK